MLLSEVDAPIGSEFNAPGWTAEIKYDGYRVLARAADGRVQLKTRNGTDATHWYPELRSLCVLQRQPLILDGEVCVLDEIGRSDFERLQDRSRRRGRPKGSEAVVYCAFDLLVADGVDLRERPLADRKKALRELLDPPPAHVLYVSDAEGQLEWLYSNALALQLEGVVAKRLDSPYLSGQRTRAWLKIKRPGAVPAERFRR
jgi:bifunctional non-homologous end joining protein LigD